MYFLNKTFTSLHICKDLHRGIFFFSLSFRNWMTIEDWGLVLWKLKFEGLGLIGGEGRNRSVKWW